VPGFEMTGDETPRPNHHVAAIFRHLDDRVSTRSSRTSPCLSLRKHRGAGPSLGHAFVDTARARVGVLLWTLAFRLRLPRVVATTHSVDRATCL